MSQKEQVTVVVPVWDAYVRFLPDAIASVRSNAAAAPLVIVDNASTTPVPDYEGADVVRAADRLSAGAARNLGLEHVQTEYVIFLDADDSLLDGTLEFLRSQIDADLSISVCVTSILDGETGERHRTPRSFVPALARRRRMFALIGSVWSLFPLQGCSIMRTAQVREAGGYADADWGEDWVLGVSVAHRGRVEVSARLGLFYRPTRGSLWRRPRRANNLAASARRVRGRIWRDQGVPSWARLLLPVVAVAQLVAVYLARPLFLALSGARRKAHRGPRVS